MMKQYGLWIRKTGRIACLLPLLLLNGAVQAIEPVDDRDSTFWLGPEILQPVDAGIGRQIEDVPFKHLHGDEGRLYQAQGKLGTVVVVRDPECPVSQRYGPRLAKLARSYQQKGFVFIYIYLNNMLTPEALMADAKTLYTPGVAVGQGSFYLADKLGVSSTGDVFVLDNKATLVYRGAVDDQYGFGYTRQAPTANYLRNAMDALLQGKPIPVPATTAPGCVIDADPKKDRLFPDIPYDAAVS